MIKVTFQLIVFAGVFILSTSCTLSTRYYNEINYFEKCSAQHSWIESPDSNGADNDSGIHDIGLTQHASIALSSVLNSEEEAVAVFSFIISDSGLRDSLPTKVTQLIIRALSNQTADWSKCIAGAQLFDGVNSIASNTSIASKTITFNFNVGTLTVDNGSTKTITLKIFFKHDGSLIDGDTFGFQINSATDAQAEIMGSQFESKGTYAVKSNLHFMDVAATRLSFTKIPISVISGIPFSVSISAIDINGCVDTQFDKQIILSLDLGNGKLISANGLGRSAVKGKCTWDDVSFSGLGVFTMKAKTDNLITAYSEGLRSEVRFFWTKTASMKSNRSHHAAVLLQDGRVFVMGNHNQGNGSTSCELFDPSRGIWISNSSLNMMFNRERLTATVLQNGDVLAAGGIGSNSPSASCELFHVSEQRWYTITAMSQARSNHTATLLRDGRVLITGANDLGSGVVSCEIFEPASNPNYSFPNTIGKWTATVSMHFQRGIHTATLLTNGKVLVTGGLRNHAAIANCEIYDPEKKLWTNVASLNFPRFAHTATLLPNGKVLVTGGGDYGDLKTCELFDPFSNNGFGDWKVVAPMSKGRMFHTATLMNDGSILVTGNWEGGFCSQSCEIYKYSNTNIDGEWRTIENMNVKRGCHSATLLQDGSVFIVGGEFNGNQNATAECEITTPILLAVENTIADKFILNQNYPNPFSIYSQKSTSISFDIPERGEVQIQIFDVTGRMIRDLLHADLDDGTYTINWNGYTKENIRSESGVYFYRLVYKQHVVTKKMIVMN